MSMFMADIPMVAFVRMKRDAARALRSLTGQDTVRRKRKGRHIPVAACREKQGYVAFPIRLSC
jgi:hypothetical protein